MIDDANNRDSRLGIRIVMRCWRAIDIDDNVIVFKVTKWVWILRNLRLVYILLTCSKATLSVEKIRKISTSVSVLRSIRPPPQVSEVRVYTLRITMAAMALAVPAVGLLQHYQRNTVMCSSSMCLSLPPRHPFLPITLADRDGVVNGSNWQGNGERDPLWMKRSLLPLVPKMKKILEVSETLSFHSHLKICQQRMNTK
jgi:hypothetical protein